MFCDLNIIYDKNNLQTVKNILALAVKLGYDCVALNHVVEGRISPQDASVPEPIQFETSPKFRKQREKVRNNTNIKSNEEVETKESTTLNSESQEQDKNEVTNEMVIEQLSNTCENEIKLASSTIKQNYVAGLRMESQRKTFKQYSRITIQLDDPSQVYTLTANNPILLSYDIVAVCPSTEKLFQQCCQNLDIDVISLDLSSKLPFSIKTPTVQQAVTRGISFEIRYSHALRDNNERRHLMSNALHLIRTTKGRNLIITSEARKAMEIRGPYDVVNLGTLFGLDPATSKNCITHNCVSVLYHGETRKTAKGVISITKLSSLTSFETWKVPQELTNAIQKKTNANTNLKNANTKDKGQQESAMEIEVANVRKRRKRKKQKNQSSFQKQTTTTTNATIQTMNDLTKAAHKRKFEETQ